MRYLFIAILFGLRALLPALGTPPPVTAIDEVLPSRSHRHRDGDGGKEWRRCHAPLACSCNRGGGAAVPGLTMDCARYPVGVPAADTASLARGSDGEGADGGIPPRLASLQIARDFQPASRPPPRPPSRPPGPQENVRNFCLIKTTCFLGWAC